MTGGGSAEEGTKTLFFFSHSVKLDDVVGLPPHGDLAVGEGARRGRCGLVLVHLFSVLVVDAAGAFHDLIGDVGGAARKKEKSAIIRTITLAAKNH